MRAAASHTRCRPVCQGWRSSTAVTRHVWRESTTRSSTYLICPLLFCQQMGIMNDGGFGRSRWTRLLAMTLRHTSIFLNSTHLASSVDKSLILSMVGSCCLADIARVRAACGQDRASACVEVMALQLKRGRARATVISMKFGYVSIVLAGVQLHVGQAALRHE